MADRENAGFSAVSWKKHGLLWRAAYGQAAAYRATHPTSHGVIVDMHAADGEGVEVPQLDFFDDPPRYPTPLLATRLAHKLGHLEVVLCEKNGRARRALQERFPEATILDDHARVLDVLRPAHRWVLALNDPCGYSSHGIEVMQEVARRIAVDWVIVFNEGALKQLLGMQDVPPVKDPPHVARVRAAKAQYAWMDDPLSWAQRLGARHMARTRLIKASPRFHYRIFVLSHTLSQALRPPLWEHCV